MNDHFSHIWGPGLLFAFSAFDGQTDYSKGLVLRSGCAGCMLEIKLPQTGGALIFDVEPPRKISFGGDFFEIETTRGQVKGAFADAYHLMISGPVLFAGITPDCYYSSKNDITVLGVKEKFNVHLLDYDFDTVFSARQQWLAKMNIPELPEPAKGAFCKALSQLKTQLNSPEGIIQRVWTTPDRWPHRNMWLWDSAFHAIALRHFDWKTAVESLLVVFDAQNSDGFVPHMATPTERSKVTQPPVLAYAAKKILDFHQDKEFMKQIYEKNGPFLLWIMKNRDTDGAGLVEWLFEDFAHCRCGESGMDNSPRFDQSVELDAPDFNAYLARDCRIMAEFAVQLEKKEEAVFWQNHCDRLNALMNERLWDAELGLYVDFDVCSNQRQKTLASSGFMPLISGAPTRDMIKKMADNLVNPERFGTPLPIPSISRDVPQLYQKDMWRGPVWININYLVAEGFQDAGFCQEATMIRDKTLAEIEKMYQKYGTFFEFYDDQLKIDPPRLYRKGKCDPVHSPYNQAFMDYGWTAALYLDWKLEQTDAK